MGDATGKPREESLAVVADDRQQRLGQREDDVEAKRREDLFAAGFEPSVLVEALAGRPVAVAARVVDLSPICTRVAE